MKRNQGRVRHHPPSCALMEEEVGKGRCYGEGEGRVGKGKGKKEKKGVRDVYGIILLVAL
eukprot:352485-Chlamydomonas_euryale.AAC.6